MNGFEAINELVDENAFLVGEQRRHAGAFDFDRLIKKDDDHQRQTDSDQEVARPNADFMAKKLVRRRSDRAGLVGGSRDIGRQ